MRSHCSLASHCDMQTYAQLPPFTHWYSPQALCSFVIHVPCYGFTTSLCPRAHTHTQMPENCHINASECWNNHVCFEGDISGHFTECLTNHLFWGKKMFLNQSYCHFIMYRFMLLIQFFPGYVFAIIPLHKASQKSRTLFSTFFELPIVTHSLLGNRHSLKW